MSILLLIFTTTRSEEQHQQQNRQQNYYHKIEKVWLNHHKKLLKSLKINQIKIN